MADHNTHVDLGDRRPLPGRGIPERLADRHVTLWRVRWRAPHWGPSSIYQATWYYHEATARRAYDRRVAQGCDADLCRTETPVRVERVARTR